MRVLVYADNTLPLRTGPLCDFLNSLTRVIRFVGGSKDLHIAVPQFDGITGPETLPEIIRQETSNFDLTIVCTHIPYHNNFFFHSTGNVIVISFAHWQLLTNLPVSNGVVYFTMKMILRQFDVGESHRQKSIGCINDWLGDKTAINNGMRAAFLCTTCAESAEHRFKGDKAVWEDIVAVLNVLSAASRANQDVLAASVEKKHHRATEEFDVFACHNWADKPAVRGVCSELKKSDIKVWLDEEQINPGVAWQPVLEDQIAKIRSAAVFVGKNGVGPWQNVEIRAFLSEFVSRRCPVIPVILPDAEEVPQLPLFLRQLNWVDLRREANRAIEHLARGIKAAPTPHRP